MERRILNNEELGMVSGGGFPNGELPAGAHICPRCGSGDLELLNESVVEDSGNPTIDSILTDKTHRLYKCNECGFSFWRYGPFWETHMK